MLIDSIINAFETSKRKNWSKIYWAIDIHGTILLSNYDNDNIPTQFYPEALETLQLMSKRTDTVLILYTCSRPEDIFKYQQLFKDNGINFQYVNSNPEVTNQLYGYYNTKFYFSVLLDDKAGFNPYTDWGFIKNIIINEPHLNG
jgi:hypothetical protein